MRQDRGLVGPFCGLDNVHVLSVFRRDHGVVLFVSWSTRSQSGLVWYGFVELLMSSQGTPRPSSQLSGTAFLFFIYQQVLMSPLGWLLGICKWFVFMSLETSWLVGKVDKKTNTYHWKALEIHTIVKGLGFGHRLSTWSPKSTTYCEILCNDCCLSLSFLICKWG